VIKDHLHIHKGAQKDDGRWKSPDNILALSASRPTAGAINLSKAHIHKPRQAERHKGR